MGSIGGFVGKGFVADAANAILTLIAKVIISIINVILTPIDSFINAIAPNLSGVLINISNFFNAILTGPVSYFLSILNNFPYFKNIIRISLSFDILFFSTIGVYYLIQGTIVVVAKIKAMIH